MSEYPVKVYIYDISKGLARTLSMPLLGKQLDGIWHTGIVVFNKEFYFGGMGIENCPPCGTLLGQPDSIVDLGTTQIPEDMFMDYLQDLSNSTFRPECYHLFDHNCNTFSNELSQFLTGSTIPAYVTDLPKEVLDTPFGAMIKPLLDQMQVSPGSGSQMFHSSPPSRPPPSASASASASASPGDQLGAAGKALASKVTMVTYNEDQILTQFASLKSCLGELNGNDASLLSEVAEYLSTPDCLWGLSPEHLRAIERTLDHTEMNESHRSSALGLLQQAVLREEVTCLLKADRKHGLMTLLHHMESRSAPLQRTLAKSLCNCLASESGYLWCTEDHDWTVNSSSMTNLKVTLRTCVACLLQDDLQVMEAGAGIATNLTNRKDVGDIYIDIGSALIQALSKGVEQPTCTERCLQSLLQCMEVTEVTALARVMGLEVKGYSTTNPRCTDLVRKIQLKLDTLTL